LFSGGPYLKRGFRFCTGAIAMPYALSTGHKRLRIMGAPRSVFAAGKRSPVIEKARNLMCELLRSLKTRAKAAAPLIEKMIQQAVKDKKKSEYLRNILRAVAGGR